MNAALLGLLGVIADAILTGGVQAAIAWFDRRRSARTSARLLYMELHTAGEAIEELYNRRSWELMVIDWRVFVAMWEKHREALASVLKPQAF